MEPKTITKLNISIRKACDQMDFTAEFHQAFKEPIPILLKLFHKEMFPNLSYKASIAPIPKSYKYKTKENNTRIYLQHRCKMLRFETYKPIRLVQKK